MLVISNSTIGKGNFLNEKDIAGEKIRKTNQLFLQLQVRPNINLIQVAFFHLYNKDVNQQLNIKVEKQYISNIRREKQNQCPEYHYLKATNSYW